MGKVDCRELWGEMQTLDIHKKYVCGGWAPSVSKFTWGPTSGSWGWSEKTFLSVQATEFHEHMSKTAKYG